MSKTSGVKPQRGGPAGTVRHETPLANKNEQGTSWRPIVLSALLTACITSLGVYLTSRYQLRQWHSEKMYTAETDLLSRRLGLVERFMKISRHQSDLMSLNALRQQDLKEMQEAVSNKDLAKVRQLMRQSSEDNHRFDELNSEYLAVMDMAVELFGPKTHAAVAVVLKNHNPQVWEASEKEQGNVVAAMTGEVLLNLGDVPADTKVSASIGPDGSTRTAQ